MRRPVRDFCMLCSESPCSCKKNKVSRPSALKSGREPNKIPPAVVATAAESPPSAPLGAAASMQSASRASEVDQATLSALRALYQGGLISEAEFLRAAPGMDGPKYRSLQRRKVEWVAQWKATAAGL